MGSRFGYGYNTRGELVSRTWNGAARDEFEYRTDGALSVQRTRRLYDNTIVRNTALSRDPAGRVIGIENTAGRWISTAIGYSALGHVIATRSNVFSPGGTLPVTYHSVEDFQYDPLGNVLGSQAFSSSSSSSGQTERQSGRWHTYQPGTERLATGQLLTQLLSPDYSSSTRPDVVLHDSAGNVEFSTQAYYYSSGSCSTESKADADCEDRAFFYGADDRLRAADYRIRLGANNDDYWRTTFEEYRYDALGRRVWVRSRVECKGGVFSIKWLLHPCASTIRRIVWDGNRELWEIQMPGADTSSYLENDVAPIPVRQYVSWFPSAQYGGVAYDPSLYSWYDPNPFYGRVAYVHGLGTDQPLSLTRFGLNRYIPAQYPNTVGQALAYAPFTSFPLWDWQGRASNEIFPGGADQHCQTFEGIQRCIKAVEFSNWSAYGSVLAPRVWHGTLVTSKADATGTLFRRARSYDPQTGRFTQEDPIGLAGGVNLYAYAGGDPVNFIDPSGEIPFPLVTGLLGAGIGAAYGGYKNGWRGALVGAAAGGLIGAGFGATGVALGWAPATLGGGAGATAGVMVGEVTVVAGPAAASGITLLPRNTHILAVVDKSGRIIAQTADVTMSHREVVIRYLNGVLPEGAKAITITKSRAGDLGIFLSRAIHGAQSPAPEWVQEAVRAVFR